ncbi:MAG: hypothetical protein LLF78_04680 [Synergistaceae bacterium]|nr:hypothetical protein [Synergistaceae bacterium]
MERKHSWQHEIDFKCIFGIWPFRRTLEITPDCFVWCGEMIPLKKITRIRWGIDQKRGGILPRRVCVATFGTKDREFTIKTKQKDFYEHITDRYWKAVGRRLLSEMLSGLKEGRKYSFGDFAVTDGGITITDKPLLGRPEEKFYAFEELQWGIVNGSLCFAPLSMPQKLLAGASFLWVDNVCLLNVALGIMMHSKNKTRLSAVSGVI